MKVRSDSVLAQLTPAQLADLYDWILGSSSLGAVQTRAAKPAAEGGFDLNIHITTLKRFYSAYTNWLRAKEIADGERAATNSPDDLHTSAATEVAHSIHDLAHGPLSTSDLKLVAKYLQQQRDHALKTEYLKLAQHHANLATDKQTLARESHEEDKRQWEYNTAGAALIHHMKFNKVLNDPDLDEREKIWKAREICFGPDPNHPTPETLWTIPTQSGPTHPQGPAASPRTQIHAPGENPSLLSEAKSRSIGTQSEIPTRRDDTLRHTTAPSPVAQPPINTGSSEKLRPQSTVLSPEKSTQIHAPGENPSLLSEAKSRSIGKRSEIPTRRDDTHLNSRSERPSMGNIIEARLGSERHTSNIPTGSCNMEPDNLRPRSARTQIHAPGENPSLLSEAKSRSIGKRSEIPTRREELRPRHSELPECDPDTLFHTVSHSPAQELQPSSISHAPSGETVAAPTADRVPNATDRAELTHSDTLRHTSNIPTGSCNMEPDNLRPRSARTQIHALQGNSVSAHENDAVPPNSELRPQHSELPECDPDTLFHTVSHSPAQQLEPSAISDEPCPQLSPQSSSLSPESRPQSTVLSPELQPSAISLEPSAKGDAWSQSQERQIPPIFNPEVTLFPTAKTASDWINTARFPKELSRWFLVKICEGSTDRFSMLLACPEPFRIPVNSLRQLGEQYTMDQPR